MPLASPSRAVTLRRSLVPLLIALSIGMAGCGKEDKAEPGSTTPAASSPAASTEASSSPAAAPTEASESPSVTAEGPQPGPASAEAIAACRAAIKKQFEQAQQKQDPGGMPTECKVLSSTELAKLINEFMNGKG